MKRDQTIVEGLQSLTVGQVEGFLNDVALLVFSIIGFFTVAGLIVLYFLHRADRNSHR